MKTQENTNEVIISPRAANAVPKTRHWMNCGVESSFIPGGCKNEDASFARVMRGITDTSAIVTIPDMRARREATPMIAICGFACSVDIFFYRPTTVTTHPESKMSETEVVTKGDLANAVDTFFDRFRDYLPPPVFVGRGYATIISILVSLIVLFVSLQPAMKMKDEAKTSMEEITAIGIIIACVFVTLIVQRTVQGVVYSMSMYKSNMQHFANTHWVAEYSKAKTQSQL